MKKILTNLLIISMIVLVGFTTSGCRKNSKESLEAPKQTLEVIKDMGMEKEKEVKKEVAGPVKPLESWTSVPTNKTPSNPSRVLSSGMTLWDAKLMIESTISSLTSSGYKVEEFTDLLVDQVKDMGTTLDEIKRLPVKVVVKAKTGGATTAKQSTVKPSTGTKPRTTTTRPSVANATDKNGNGIEDSMESSMGHADGTTNVPNDQLGLNGIKPKVTATDKNGNGIEDSMEGPNHDASVGGTVNVPNDELGLE